LFSRVFVIVVVMFAWSGAVELSDEASRASKDTTAAISFRAYADTADDTEQSPGKTVALTSDTSRCHYFPPKASLLSDDAKFIAICSLAAFSILVANMGRENAVWEKGEVSP
jgi:hypothetical protein